MSNEVTVSGGAASPDEAMAIVAAVERFAVETAPAPAPPETVSPWQRAALIEGVSAKQRAFPADPGSGFPLRLG